MLGDVGGPLLDKVVPREDERTLESVVVGFRELADDRVDHLYRNLVSNLLGVGGLVGEYMSNISREVGGEGYRSKALVGGGVIVIADLNGEGEKRSES